LKISENSRTSQTKNEKSVKNEEKKLLNLLKTSENWGTLCHSCVIYVANFLRDFDLKKQMSVETEKLRRSFPIIFESLREIYWEAFWDFGYFYLL
jgi:hypothetical protein